MPKYTYRCDACGHEIERTHRIGTEDPIACPLCWTGQDDYPLMRIKPQFTPTLYSGSPAFYGAMKTYPKCGPR